MVLTIAPLGIFEISNIKAYAAIYEGNQKDGSIRWTLDSNSGEMIISGTGEMEYYIQYYHNPYLNSYDDKIKSVKIKDGVTTVGANAFCYCYYLSNVEIAKTVKEIHMYAFYCCSFSEIEIPKDVSFIGISAFGRCTNLRQILLPAKVEKIENSAFSGCSGLKSIYLGSKITNIGKSAFSGCSNLKDVYFSGTEEQWNSINIDSDNSCLTKATIHYNYNHPSDYYPEPTASYDMNNLKSGDSILLSAFKETYGEKKRLSDVSWYSTNPSVASVSSAGLVTIKDKGLAQIYFKYADKQSTYLQIISNGYIVTEDFNIMNTKPDAMPSIDIAGQQVLDKTGFDIREILSNISLEGGKLKGPTVNIMGQEVTLFEFDVGAEFPLLDETTIIVDQKEKKIKVGIGIKEENSAQVGKAGQKTTYWSESYREVKKLYQNATGKKVTTTKLWNDFSALRGRLKKINGKMALNCDTYLAGYLEFSYSGRSYEFIEGGVLAECNFGASVESRWASFPAAYTVFGVKAGAHGDLTVKVEDYKSSYTGNIGGDLAASFGVGLGEKNVTDTYIEGGMEATLGVNFAFPATSLKNSMTIDMTGDLYITAHAVGYELYSDKFTFTNVQLYPTFKQNKRMMMLRSVSPTEVESAASPVSRDYTTDGSKIDLTEDTFKKSDIYGFNSPSLVRFGDNKHMLVWVDDDGTKSDINRTTLYYSVFNGSVWSTPSVVYESKGYNGAPVVISDGTNVHILWGMSPEMSEAAGYTDLIESIELNYIKYNGTSFESPVKITDNSTLEFSYDMYVSDSKVTFTWIENTDNNSFMGTGENVLKSCTISNSEVTEPKAIYETEDIINGSTFVNSKHYVITENDNGSYLYEIVDGNCTELRSIAERMSQLDNFDGLVTFVEDSRLIKYNGETFYAFNLENVDNYSYVTNGTEKAILTLVYGENGTVKMMSSYYNEESKTWSSFVPVLDEDTYIRNYSPIMDNEGEILAAVNSIELNENPATDGRYGEATLFVLNGTNYFDLAVGDYLSKGKLEGEDDEKLFFEVTNYSSVTVDSLTVDIIDTNGGNNSVDIACELLPGETKEFSVAYDGLSAFGKKDITVTVSNKSYVENNKNNNSVTTTIGYADIAVENVVATYDECKGVLKFDVKNIGFENADNIVVSVVANNGSNVNLKRETIEKLAPDECNEYICIIPADLLSNDNEDVFNSLTISVKTDAVEESTVNNTESIGYSDFSELVGEGVEKAEHNYESVITAPTCTEVGYTTYTCTVCGDSYTDDVVETTGHNFNHIINIEPSCNQQGYRLSECLRCGAYEESQVASTGHKDKDEDGYCDVCYDSSCDCVCHKTGLVGIVWKIFKVLFKSFKANSICTCGQAHY